MRFLWQPINPLSLDLWIDIHQIRNQELGQRTWYPAEWSVPANLQVKVSYLHDPRFTTSPLIFLVLALATPLSFALSFWFGFGSDCLELCITVLAANWAVGDCLWHDIRFDSASRHAVLAPLYDQLTSYIRNRSLQGMKLSWMILFVSWAPWWSSETYHGIGGLSVLLLAIRVYRYSGYNSSIATDQLLLFTREGIADESLILQKFDPHWWHGLGVKLLG